jgi:fatty acid desaturase
LINDPRDVPFVALTLWISLTVLPAAVVLFIPGVFRWWLAVLYYALVLQFLDKFILMLHNTSHRKLYKPSFGALNSVIPWVLGPFFGETPDTYFAHHIGMHHPENNLEVDGSCTMGYRRDSALHFLHYYFSFLLVGGLYVVKYLRSHQKGKLARRFLVGELGCMALYGLGLYLAFWPTLVVFVIPVFVTRFLMMAGNWGQHAFIAADDPGNPLLNSITCIETRYNERCFNDGYHIGHHVKASRHWTELPSDFEASKPQYAVAGSVVFAGIDFFGVWLLLMVGAYRKLAKHVVHLGGAERSPEDVVAFLRSRTRPIVRSSEQRSARPRRRVAAAAAE